jgi:pimeloyl-ACP methyl ester carboxylesterase
MTTFTHNSAPTEYVEADGVRFAYRRFGKPGNTPLVFIQHFRGNMDNFDPAITDPLATHREVVLFDNRGVANSNGTARETVDDMARDSGMFIDALGLREVDVVGHSMGGEVAQMLAIQRSDMVKRLVLVGTGPRGGEGMAAMKPATAELFAKEYERQDEMWLPIMFAPSEKSVAAGWQFLERIRARRGRASGGRGRMGQARSTRSRLFLPQADFAADARGQREQRYRHRHGQLVHSPAEHPQCEAGVIS